MSNTTDQHDRDAIRAHIDGLFQAFIRKDREVIHRGHTSDWTGFQVMSSHIVRGIDDYMKAVDATLEAFEYLRYEILDIDIHLHGDTAVVFYLAQDWVRGKDGDELPSLIRSVDIYRREGAGWNQCGSNICLVPTKS